MANGTEGTGKVYGLGNGSGRLFNVSAAGDKSSGYQIGVRHNFYFNTGASQLRVKCLKTHRGLTVGLFMAYWRTKKIEVV